MVSSIKLTKPAVSASTAAAITTWFPGFKKKEWRCPPAPPGPPGHPSTGRLPRPGPNVCCVVAVRGDGPDAKRAKGDAKAGEVMSLEQVLAKRKEENKAPKLKFVSKNDREKNAAKEADKQKAEQKKKASQHL